jgi:hypothetical protein
MLKKIIEEIFIESSSPDEFYKNFIKMLSQENIKKVNETRNYFLCGDI